ncbi:hypothetical protein Tco_0542992 [Tanacetum coccineum]
MAGYSYAQLKDKSFDEVQKLFEKHMKWINSFVPMEEDLPLEKVQKEESSEKKAEGSNRKKSIGRKRAKDKQEQESSKRQRVEDDKEEEELKKCFELAKEEDLKLSMGITARDANFEKGLGVSTGDDLGVMLEPDIESEVWRSLQGYKISPYTNNNPHNTVEQKFFQAVSVGNEMVYQLLKFMIQKMNIKFKEGLLGLKGFLKLLLLSTTGTKVNAAGLQLLEEV